jgi:hypothetical protein
LIRHLLPWDHCEYQTCLLYFGRSFI